MSVKFWVIFNNSSHGFAVILSRTSKIIHVEISINSTLKVNYILVINNKNFSESLKKTLAVNKDYQSIISLTIIELLILR